jgi:DNA-binding NarL/FixJ family response regulator
MLRTSNTIRINVVECQKVVRDGLAAMINSTHGYHIINTYESCSELLKGLTAERPDVILAGTDCLNDHTFASACISHISKIKTLAPKTKIIVFTSLETNELVFQTLKAGADGYITKTTQPVKLLESIREVYEGGAPLSPSAARAVVSSFHKNTSSILTNREVQVMELLSTGKTYYQIADKLFIDKETVRTHIKNIYFKLDVHSKADAIEKARVEKII